jgi:lactoylglutathione lyase
MIPILDLFETHLTVSDLRRSMAFYGGTLGLELAQAFAERRVAFYWIGSGRAAMLGIWEVGSAPQRISLHTAFRVDVARLLEATDRLRAANVVPLDFSQQPTSEPVVLAWMPAAALYFTDPDGNLLEFISMLPQSPRPDLGVVSWSDWLRMGDVHHPVAIEIRPAVPEDADGIARTFLESAAYHAELDPERYSTPAVETISERYLTGRQHPSHAGREVMTLVAELSGEIVGFIDARLEQSPDAMHREMFYCHIAEIAVRCGRRNQGIGGRLLRAAEDWGRRLGAEFASLEYHSANSRAGSFYQERLGYRLASITAIKRL